MTSPHEPPCAELLSTPERLDAAPAAFTYIGRRRIPILEHTIPEPNSGCLLWLGSCDLNGYGRIRLKDKWHRIHRLVWREANGEIPDGMHVCHKCDVRLCINPAHLWLGTNQDNVDDRVAKGRSAGGIFYGERNWSAKLTDEIVAIIRGSSAKTSELAARFGVHRSTISRARDKRHWTALS